MEKWRELVDMMEGRKTDMYLHETRLKGSKARSTEGGFKLFYPGADRKRNGAVATLKEEYVYC